MTDTYEQSVEKVAEILWKRKYPGLWHETKCDAEAICIALGLGPDNVIVPREPTEAMVAACLNELSDATVEDQKAAAWDVLRAYKAMIAAAEKDAK